MMAVDFLHPTVARHYRVADALFGLEAREVVRADGEFAPRQGAALIAIELLRNTRVCGGFGDERPRVEFSSSACFDDTEDGGIGPRAFVCSCAEADASGDDGVS